MIARHRWTGIVAAGWIACACDAASSGSPDASMGPDAPGLVDTGADAAPPVYTPVPFAGQYAAHRVLTNRCDRAMNIVGSEPAEPGRYPVAIFLVGTSGIFDGPGIVEHVLPALTKQGFVAASLQYENSTLFGAAQNCSLYQDNAECMVRNDADYVDGERRSAIAQLCGRAKADCSKGVVVLGHSQGGMTALQTFRFTPATPPADEPMPKLVAAAPMGVGAAGYLAGIRVINLDACMTADTIVADKSKLLIVNGEHDRYFSVPGVEPAGNQVPLETVTGRHCAVPSWDCRGATGDGWVLVQPSELTTGLAVHDYMHDHGADPATPFAEPNWISPDTTAPWGLYSTARWLRAQIPE